MESIVSSLSLNDVNCENNTSLVILLSVVTSNLRNIQVSHWSSLVKSKQKYLYLSRESYNV